MKESVKSIFKPKKVELSDVASPKPSRAATRVLSGAIKRAYSDQLSTTRRARELRAN